MLDGALSPLEVQGLLGVVMRGVLDATVSPGQATAIAAVARAAVAVREVAELEQRLADLEVRAGVGYGGRTA
jgi:hypothetical protein